MTPPPTQKERRPLFFGWKVVLGAFLGEMTSVIAGPPVFGFFIIPMTQAMHVGRGLFTLAFSIRAVMEGLSGPVIGPVVDRHGPRALMVIGSIVSGLVIMSFGGVHAFWQFAVACALLGVAAAAGMGRIVTLVTVARWFVRKRGRAVAFATTGFSVGVALLAPLSQALISAIGWRLSWVILGGLLWLLVVPAAFAFMRKSPESMGLRPDGEPVGNGGESTSSKSGPSDKADLSWTLAMAVRTRSLWLLELAIILGATAVPGVTFHQAPVILDKGLGVPIAAAVIFIFGIASGFSKVGFGFLAERIPVQYLFIGCMMGSSGSLLLLLNADSTLMVVAYAVTYGLLRGGFPTLESVVWADYFGRTSLGTIRGVFQPFILIARASGPLIAGVLFDLTKDYDLAITTFIVMFMVGGLVLIFAPPPRYPTSVRQATEGT